MVEATHDLPRAKHWWQLGTEPGQTWLQGPSGEEQVLSNDIHALDEAGLLEATSYNYAYGNTYVISQRGRAYYSDLKKREGESAERQVAEVRSFVDSEAFRTAYPVSYARWAEAEVLLWSANSDREFTTIGHKTREALQEFATEVVQRYKPPDVDEDPAHVNRRLGATIAMYRENLGEARSKHLEALGGYSEATMALVQRQEHGGQKEGHQLRWTDARRVVFHAVSVMFEFAQSLNECVNSAEP